MSEPGAPLGSEAPAGGGKGSGDSPGRRDQGRERRNNRPGRLRRWVVRPFIWGLALLALVVVGGYYLITSQLGRGRVADLVVTRTSQFLGRDVQVGSLDYTFFPLAFELTDVVIPGPRPGDPPVAVVPLVRIQSSWQDLRQNVLLLEEIAIERPLIYLQLNPDGTSNLPSFRTRAGGGQGRFETRIGRILVQDGELRINHRRLPLRLDARAVWGRLTGTADRRRLEALVTAQEVTIELPDARPYSVTVSARGTLQIDQGAVQVASVRMASPDLRAQGSGTIGWRGEPRVDLAFQAEGDARLANRLGYLEQPIEGAFRFDGRFDLEGEQWSYGGAASSPRIAVLGRVLRDVAAELDGRPEELVVDVERAGYAGGTVAGEVRVDTDVPAEEKEAGTPVALDLSFRDLAIETLLADQDAPIENLSGTAGGTALYSFRTRDPLAGSGEADVRLAAREQESGVAFSGRVPLTIERGVLTSRDVQLAAPGQQIAGSGSLDLEPFGGEIEVRLDTQDVGWLARLVPVEGAEPPAWLPTAGQGRAEGTVRFGAGAFSADVTLSLQDVAAPALALDQVAGSFRFTPGAIEDLSLAARRGAGRLDVSGRIPLPEDGRIAPGERLALDLTAVSWPAASLAGLAPGAPSLTGEIDGRADVGGTFDKLAGSAELRVSSLAVDGNALGDVEAAVAFDGPLIRIDQAVVQMPAGELLASGSWNRDTGAVQATADAPAIALDREPLRRYLRGVGGEATLAATVDGTVDSPQATLTLRGSDLALNGRPLGQAGEADVLATWDGERVSAAGSLLGLLSFDGGGRLDREGAEVAFTLRSESLAGLARVATQQPLPDFTGALDGTVTATADFAAGTFRAELGVERLALEYEGRQIANLEPISIALTPERLRIVSFYMGEPEHDTELFVSGTVGLGEGAALDLNVLSTIWVGWLQLLLPDYGFSGFADVLATVRGTAEAPLLNGEAVLRDARVILPDLPHAVEEITGVVFFDRQSVIIDNVTAEMGGGVLRAFGNLELPVGGAPLRYQLQARADDLSLRYPEGWLIRGDAQVSLSGTAEAREIRGAIELERAFYLEDVKVGTVDLLRGALTRERLEVASTDDALAATELFLTVRGDDALRVRNNVANLTGDLDLLVRGTAARPVVFGRVELAPGGELTYAENEYEIERGLLTFENPYRIDPVIDLVATAEVQSFEITLNLSGTLERLDANFSSNANLADLEILALIATGQELSNEGELFAPGERQEEGLGASGFLAGQAASVLSKRVGTLFGFDRFRINPISGETGETLGGVGVTVGKRLSRDVFVTYSTNPSSTLRNVLQVEWRVAENLTLVLTQSTDGYAVDAQWERRF